MMPQNVFVTENPIRIVHERFMHIKLPKSLKIEIERDIAHWYKHNGAQWTVDRLKFVRQCCINYLADGSLPPKDADVWFRRNRQGLLYGPYGALMKLMNVSPQSVMKLIMVYTVFATDAEPSDKQISKFKSVVEGDFTGNADKLEKLNNKLTKHSKHIIKKYVRTRYNDVPSPGNYMIYARTNNVGHKTNMWWTLQDCFSHKPLTDLLLTMPWVESVFSSPVENLMPPPIPPEFLKFAKVRPLVIGDVNWINEPGMKERIVTDFKKPLEHLTKPLGDRLYDIVKKVPWDATFHEERGYNQIQDHLRSGGTCYCYDLTAATDRFPLSTQLAVLKSLDFGQNYRDQLALLELAVTGNAELPNGELVKWNVGQPMGAYPSFAMFSLTHGMVLMEYLYSHGIEYKNQFVVHGDDLVIMDQDLAHFYEGFLVDSGVKVNPFKTIISNKVAEFNSRLITRSGHILMRKWRPITPASLIDAVSYWGPVAIKWAYRSKKKREIVERLLSIPSVLPNGNSINPLGLSQEERLARIPDELLDIISTRPVKLNEFISFRSLVLERFRLNKYMDLDLIGHGDQQNIYLQSLLDALNVADTLDREILQDCQNFVSFMNPKLALPVDNQGLELYPCFLDYLRYLVKEFNEAFSPVDKLFTFNFIRQQKRDGYDKRPAIRLDQWIRHYNVICSRTRALAI